MVMMSTRGLIPTPIYACNPTTSVVVQGAKLPPCGRSRSFRRTGPQLTSRDLNPAVERATHRAILPGGFENSRRRYVATSDQRCVDIQGRGQRSGRAGL